MSKRILITSTDLMMIQFLISHVINLVDKGFEVEVACSEVGGRLDEVRKRLNDYVNKIHKVSLVRSPLSTNNFKGYQEMKKIIDDGGYDIVWTNEPVMGVVTRLAAKKARRNGTKVIYMVHGFHFFKGGSKLNWLLYFPVEKFMASCADMIVTVNKEDYQRAQKMNVNEVKYIHGIGINTQRLTIGEQKNDIRKELGIKEEDFIVLSVGELNKNKNQKVILEAIAMLKDPEIHYVLCGKGDQLEHLKQLANNLQINKNVHFLGYRTDVVDICSQSDVYVMPSLREGLPVASLEAMYCGLPLVTSNIRGLVDVMEDGKTGYLCNPRDEKAFAEGIRKLKEKLILRKQMGVCNKEIVKPFCLENTKLEILQILEEV